MTDAEARVQAENIRAAAQLEAARIQKEPPAFGPGSAKLGRPGFYPTDKQPGVADLRAAAAKQAGAELGEPTSFKGGAGAPEPIGVIRGMQQTYATEAGGPNLSEYATPLQARQAYNRARGVGEYMPAGGALAAEGAKATGVQAAIDERGMARNVEDFTNMILGEEGGRFVQQDPQTGKIQLDDKGNPMMDPALRPLILRLQPLARKDPDAAYQKFLKEAPRILAEVKFINPEGIAKAMENFAKTMGRPLTEEEKAFLNPQDDPEKERQRRNWIMQWGQYQAPDRPQVFQGKISTESEPAPLKPPETISIPGLGEFAGPTKPIVIPGPVQGAVDWLKGQLPSLRPREERLSGNYERKLKPLGTFR